MSATMQHPEIDVYAHAKAYTAMATTTLTDFIDAIRSDEFAAKIARLRSTLAAGDDDGYAVAKKGLHAVSISGTADGRRWHAMEEGRFSHSGLLQLDFDAADNVGWTVEEIVEILQAEPRIVAAFVSPSGHGVKGIARIPVCQTKDEHVAAFAAARNHFRAHNLTIDEACKDPVRLMFVSHDPGAWLDLDRTAVFEPVAAANGTCPKPKNPGIKLKAPRTAFPEPPREGIHAWLMEAAWHCRRNGLVEQAATAKLEAYDGTLRRPFQENEVRDAVRKVYGSPMPSAGTRTTDSDIPEDRIAFNPMDVFYDGPSGKYLVDAGDYFRTLGRKSPVVTGVIRHFKTLGCDDKEAKEEARNEIADAEIDRHVEWSGNLAGHRKGLMESVDGRPMLVLTSPAIPEPITAPCPVILEIIRQAFPDDTQRNVFLGWLSGSYKAVRAAQHHPAPMLVLAGKMNAGKSLLALIAGYVMGGRTANPHAAWSGSMAWNDDLFGSELLLLDDSTGSTDIRSRMNFAASFKESIYAANVQLRKRHATSMSARPVWRVMVCCNDNAESLLIVPPIGTDMADKIALLKVSKVTTPVDASNTEGQAMLRAMIREELPAFAAILSRFQIPEELRDSRAGITAWRHPELAAALESTKPEHRLEELLETAIRSSYHLWPDLPATLKASEIEGRLLDKDSPVREQAKMLFGTWTAACGTWLGRLADGGTEIVKRGGIDGHTKIGSYTVSRP